MLNTDYINFVAWSPATSTIVAPSVVLRLLEGWWSLGYQLTEGLAWPFQAPNNLITDRDTIHRKVLDACDLSKRRRSLNLWLQPFEFDFRIVQHSPTASTEWMITVENDTFIGPNNDLGGVNAVNMIEVIEKAVGILPTLYGCLFSAQDPPSSQQVLGCALDTAYPVNFFGEVCISKIGAKKLHTSPAWRIKEIGDGLLIASDDSSICGRNLTSLRVLQRYLFGETNADTDDFS